MATIVSLRVRGIDFHDDARLDWLEHSIPEVTFSRQNGFTLAEIFVADGSQNAYHAVTDIILRLRSMDAAVIDGVEPLLVNTSDIANLAGVSRQAVLKWVRRSELAFPRELDSVGGGNHPQKIWSLYTINEWLRKTLNIDLGLGLPTSDLVRRIDAFIVDPHDPVSDEWHSTGFGTAQQTVTVIQRSNRVSKRVEVGFSKGSAQRSAGSRWRQPDADWKEALA